MVAGENGVYGGLAQLRVEVVFKGELVCATTLSLNMVVMIVLLMDHLRIKIVNAMNFPAQVSSILKFFLINRGLKFIINYIFN